MRYQEYKNKMVRIRRVINFFYRFRFVFLGVAVVTAASITTLDLTKGNITDVSKFDEVYTYGDKITFGGEAFMSDVTFEFKEVGANEWTETVPSQVGSYEARGRSQGNHGYKYSKVSTFKIAPYEATINLADTSIDFGNDHPALTYSLLPGHTLNEKIVDVTYDDLTSRTTYARIDLTKETSIQVLDSEGRDITNNYSFTTEDKEITFNKAPLNIYFVQETSFAYTGESFSCNTVDWNRTNDTIYYDAHIEITGGISKKDIGRYDNDHGAKVVSEDGLLDYSENYDIKINDNYIEIGQAPAVTITSLPLSKTYNGQKFEQFDDPMSLIEISPSLLNGHHFKLLGFDNKDVYKAGTYTNSFTYDIVDDEENPVDRTLYKGISTSFGSITINKKPITLVSKSLETMFDNQYHSIAEFKEFENPEDGLVPGDAFDIDADGSTSKIAATPATGVDNEVKYEIKRGEEIVTDCYDITPVYGKITINQYKIKFNFTARSVVYNGLDNYYYIANDNLEVYDTEEKRQNAAVIDPETPLPTGWTYDVHLPDSYKMKYVGDFNSNKPKESDVIVHIYDNSEPAVEVTNYFSIGSDITFDFPTSTISKKSLTVTVKDYTKEYDNQTIGHDLVIDPNNGSVCVEYDGLVDGDYAKVSFNGNASENTEVSDTPYSIQLNYGVKNGLASNAKDVTDNYNITFKDNKNTIDATITKKPIVIVPGSVTKTYDDKLTFTPSAPTCKAPDGMELLGTETASIKTTTLSGNYKTSSTFVGSYKYDLDPNDVVIKIGTKDVTNDYDISIEGQGDVTIDQRKVKISATDKSTSPYKTFYDAEQHGAFTGAQSEEISIQAASGNAGIISGHSVEITNPQVVTAPGSVLHVDSSTNSADLGLVIRDSKGVDVSSNYLVSHDALDVEIVQTVITITPLSQAKVYDGFPFDDGNGVGIGEYIDYKNAKIKDKLFSVTVQSTATHDPLLEGKHVLKLRKYSQATADAAENVGKYDFDYDYTIETSSGEPVASGIYVVNLGSGTDLLTVSQAYFDISVNSGSKKYNGYSCQLPANVNNLITSSSSDVYITGYSYGPKFSERFTISAIFTTGSYDPNEMYAPGVYHCPVEIIVNDNQGGYDPSNIKITRNYGISAYDYTITKASITISTTKTFKGLSYRDWSGTLASTDSVYFGDEPLQSSWYAYTHDIYECRILRNGVTDVTDTCYNVNYSVPS